MGFVSTGVAQIRRIVLLGPPASGKGTQAELLQTTYGLPVTSTGAMLREEKRLGTALGREADALTRDGHFVSDQVVIRVIATWLEKNGDEFVFDGFPRTVGQADALQDLLAKRRTPLQATFALEATVEKLQERMAGRLVCLSCGQIVGVGLQVTAVSDPCPRCGGVLGRRADDSPETLVTRLEQYHEKTAPLLDYYQQRGLLYRIDSTRAPQDVFADFRKVIERP